MQAATNMHLVTGFDHFVFLVGVAKVTTAAENKRHAPPLPERCAREMK